MISSKEALNIILGHKVNFESEVIDINNSYNRIILEDIKTSRDMPPFDRVAMDGIVIQYKRWLDGQREFKIENIQAAGSPQLELLNSDHCIEVMTGSVKPKNTDTVIPYEHLEAKEGSFIIKKDLKKGSNIHSKGKDKARGEVIIPQKSLINPAIVANLASEGYRRITVKKLPKICIVSTGDELVAIDQEPLEHQIRSSNSYMLKSCLAQLNLSADIMHIIDDKSELQRKLSLVLEKYDVLIMSGGVSKGKYDFVPEVLENLGVKKQFHRVAQKPGKPFWFGLYNEKPVFALPGNPSSSLLCYKYYCEQWLLTCLGHKTSKIKVKLKSSFTFNSDLTYFAQAKLSEEDNIFRAEIKKSNGSGDMSNLVLVDGYVELPQGQNEFDTNSFFNFYKI